jgi:hypothetical protein
VEFAHAHPLTACLIATRIWLVALFSALRPFSAELLLDRFPFVPSDANLALEYAVMMLPAALPNRFDSLPGHSIYGRSLVLTGNGQTAGEYGSAALSDGESSSAACGAC